MKRNGVINHCRNALFFEKSLETVSFFFIFKLNCILRPTGTEIFWNNRRLHNIGQLLCIPRRRLIHPLKLIFLKSPELWQQNCSLQRIQPGIPADADIFILIRTFSVNADGFQIPGRLIIIRENSAAVPVTAKRLCRKKGGSGDIPKGTRPSFSDAAAKALRGVLQYV